MRNKFLHSSNCSLAQLGIKEADANTNIEMPTLISSLSSFFVKKITCGGVHSAALTDTNQIYLWGDGRNGRIGFGSEDASPLPRLLHLSESLVTESSLNKENVLRDLLSVDICCGWSHTIILLQTKDFRTFVFTCGRGSSGQCGHGEAKDELRPRLVEGLLDK